MFSSSNRGRHSIGPLRPRCDADGVGRLHHHLQHAAHIRLPDLAPEFNRRLAIELGRSLHHVEFLVHPHATDRAIVLDPDEERPPSELANATNVRAILRLSSMRVLKSCCWCSPSAIIRRMCDMPAKMAWPNVVRKHAESTGFCLLSHCQRWVDLEKGGRKPPFFIPPLTDQTT